MAVWRFSSLRLQMSGLKRRGVEAQLTFGVTPMMGPLHLWGGLEGCRSSLGIRICWEGEGLSVPVSFLFVFLYFVL